MSNKKNNITEILTKFKSSSVGYQPEYLNTAEKVIWREIIQDCPEGYFIKSHRHKIAKICILMNKLRANFENFSDEQHETLINLLVECRMTPASRINNI
jgi:hypothetical protein